MASPPVSVAPLEPRKLVPTPSVPGRRKPKIPVYNINNSIDEIRKLNVYVFNQPPPLLQRPEFQDPWFFFRDHAPLGPDTSSPKWDLKSLSAHVDAVYEELDALTGSSYERPTSAEMLAWGIEDYLRCAEFQLCRNLSKNGQPLHEIFVARRRSKEKSDKSTTIKNLKSAIMALLKFVMSILWYHLWPLDEKEPHGVISWLENVRPMKDPRFSAVPDVRRRHALMGTNVEKMRVLARQLSGTESEKNFLVDYIMLRERADRAGECVVVKEGVKKKSVGGKDPIGTANDKEVSTAASKREMEDENEKKESKNKAVMFKRQRLE